MDLPSFLLPRGIEHGTRQASVFGIGISFAVFIMVVILLRLYVRISLINAIGVDDVLMVIGAVFTFGLSVASMIAAYHGTGKHVEEIPMTSLPPMLKAIYSTRLIYIIAMLFVKMSLLWFYLRLDRRRRMKWTVYFLMFFVIGISVSSFFVLAFSCYPPAMFWDVEGTVEGECMSPGSQQAFYDANGILNIVTDIFIYLTPIPMLWGVKISGRKKGALFAIFGLGILAVAAGCVRYDYVRLLSNTADQYYFLADSLNWCSIEIYVAIFCGSAPALSVLIKTYAPRVFGSSYGRHDYESDNTPGNSSGQTPAQRLSGRGKDIWHKAKISGRRGLQDTTLTGSEEAIVPGDGIVLKTELRMDVMQRERENAEAAVADEATYKGSGVRQSV
ncbi:hypothetical protein P170DRAFT_463334 [Aspergillus steynii IBT 23096]|uniref:Rhodopsin domain-containing protein n=1 Tax=Aspergillus steynii IBT 23096 TaxID=1392250 RepID=A0A2I2GAY7_9EURO|nr:uncharacterized protein P170DRAFT_463334 [Aspergillus steynii IBT 23096]PLB50030.1 hypothetical protein P170DRAFT_463334 [Aspergillus steynii IBT 23096]